jgi:ABC-type lipoprotein export system ATPase subunit
MITIQNLTKTFDGPDGEITALRNVTLQINAGEFIAVQGPSGCGKSTLLMNTGGLLIPDGGQVVIDGEDLYALSSTDRARFRAERIGFVFQQFHLVPYLSVLDNVLTPSLAMPLRDANRRAAALIDHFGLTERRRHVPGQLSVGERQRTALARALLTNPSVLLADEPTGNLDGENAGIVLEHLREFANDGGTVLLVTHDPRSADYAQRSIHLNKGSLCEPQTAGT